jgi:hypothetical protein
MTLTEAERKSDHFISLLASKPRDSFCRTSQLGGLTLCEISNAFALVIAKRRQIAGEDSSLRRKCKEGTG